MTVFEERIGGKAAAGSGSPANGDPTAWNAAAPAILIVDDEPAICDLIVQVLRKEYQQVMAVGDGASALRILSQSSVQVLLCDFKLPDMDGVAVVSQALLQSPKTVAVIMTGYASVDVAVKAMKAGAMDFLTKPVHPALLSLTVQRALELQHLRVENAVLKHGVLQAGTVKVKPVQLSDLSSYIGSNQFASPEEPGLCRADRVYRTVEVEQAQRRRDHALFAEAVAKLHETRAGWLATAADEVAALAFSIAGKLCREAVESRRAAIVEQAQAALARVRDAPLARICVHPEDVPVLEQAAAALARMFDAPVTIRVEGRPELAPGDCVVETPNRLIDVSLDAQLLRLGEALKRRDAHAA